MSERSQTPDIRPSVLAGTWYPGTPGELSRSVAGYLDGADPRTFPERPVAIVAPHAGYIYSGPVAGRIFGLLRGHRYDRVFILSPSHRAHLDRVSPSPHAAYATPLGEVPVDREVADALAAGPAFRAVPEAHEAEHAEEIQVPFLQETLGGDLRIVPLLVPPLTPELRRDAAAALAPWCDGGSLLVVSSDFTHYGAAYGYVPFADRVPERLAELDGGAIGLLLDRDPEGLLAYGRRTGITMCGIEAAALALSAPLPGGSSAQIDYRRSADRDGDFSFSVSYAALVLSTAPHPEAAEENP